MGSPHLCGTITNEAEKGALFGTMDWIFGFLVPGTLIKTCDQKKKKKKV